MVDGRRRQTAILLLVPAAVVGASLAGCTSSSRVTGRVLRCRRPRGPRRTRSVPRSCAAALLTRVNGVGAASAAASGDYTSIAAQEAAQQAAKGAPKACAQATETGLDSAALVGATAASVSFKVGGNDVSELLAAAPGTAAASALAGRLPASCARYKATVDGKTVTYSVTESTLSRDRQAGQGPQRLVGGGRLGRRVVARLPRRRVRRRGDRGRPQLVPDRSTASSASRPTTTRPSHCPRTGAGGAGSDLPVGN